MRYPIVLMVFILMFSACKSQKRPQPANSPKTSSFNLRVEAWRNLMPSIDAEADRSAYCTIEMVLPDSLQPHQLQWQECCLKAISADDSVWCFEPLKWEWNAEKRLLYTSLGGGPKWRPDRELNVLVQLTVDGKNYEQRLEKIYLMGTY